MLNHDNFKHPVLGKVNNTFDFKMYTSRVAIGAILQLSSFQCISLCKLDKNIDNLF